MIDDDLDRRLARWMADHARADIPMALREPAHLLATRRPSVTARSGVRSLAGLAVGGALIIVAALGLRAMSASSPASAPGSMTPSDASPPASASPLQTPAVPRSDWSTVTWSLADPTPFGGPGNQFITGIVPLADGFVAGGYETGDRPTAIVWRAPAGEPWTRVGDPSGTFDDSIIDSLVAVPDGIIAIGRPGSPDGARGVRLWKSADGRIWTRLPIDPATFGPGYQPGVGIASGPAGLIAYVGDRGTGGTHVWHSTDGSSWTPDPAAELTFGEATLSIAGTAFGYVATGTVLLDSPSSDLGLGPDGVGVAFRSTDGRTWEQAVVDGAHGLGRVYVARDGLLADGTSHGPTRAIMRPEYWQSADGRHWRRIPDESPVVASLGVQLTADGDRMYALSPWSTSWSADGSSWHPVDVYVRDWSAPQSWFYQVASGPGGIVASGYEDRGTSSGSDSDSNMVIWQAVPGQPPSDALPMPTPEPMHDQPCPTPQQNDDGTCGP